MSFQLKANKTALSHKKMNKHNFCTFISSWSLLSHSSVMTSVSSLTAHPLPYIPHVIGLLTFGYWTSVLVTSECDPQ